MKKRLSRIPGFVAKVDGQLYYTEIPSNFSLPDDFMNGKHCCSLGSRVCKFLKPLPIQEGGCDKVLDSCVTFQSRMGYKFETAVLKSQRIEKYDWIIEGYETFNIPCNENIFQITCCSRVQY